MTTLKETCLTCCSVFYVFSVCVYIEPKGNRKKVKFLWSLKTVCFKSCQLIVKDREINDVHFFCVLFKGVLWFLSLRFLLRCCFLNIAPVLSRGLTYPCSQSNNLKRHIKLFQALKKRTAQIYSSRLTRGISSISYPAFALVGFKRHNEALQMSAVLYLPVILDVIKFHNDLGI